MNVIVEQRATPRHRVLKAGRIAFNGGRSTISCQLRDLSAGGAKLMFSSILGIPADFDLMISDGPRRPCRVAWRSGQNMGVAFINA